MNQSEKPLTNRCTRIEVELEKTDQHNFPEFSFLSLKNELEKATETEGTADVKDGTYLSLFNSFGESDQYFGYLMLLKMASA